MRSIGQLRIARGDEGAVFLTRNTSREGIKSFDRRAQQFTALADGAILQCSDDRSPIFSKQQGEPGAAV